MAPKQLLPRARWALSAALFAVAACLAMRLARGPRRPSAPVIRKVSYVNHVSTAGTSRDPSGAVRFRTDRGFEVRLDRAVLMQRSASLVDCAGVGGDVWERVSSWAGDLLSLERKAYASHGQGLDPSAIGSRLVNLLEDDDGARQSQGFAPSRYCRVHLLFAGQPHDSYAPLAGATLYAEGAWRRVSNVPNENAFVPFRWQTTKADALLLDVPALAEGDLDGDEAQVSVERPMAKYFDGIELSEDGEGDAFGAALLRNANHGARIRVRFERRKRE
jgi:hypothetical protein